MLGATHYYMDEHDPFHAVDDAAAWEHIRGAIAADVLHQTRDRGVIWGA